MKISIDSNAYSVQVSILMITYNHEKYIEQAIQAVLAQETKFAIELLICNDASTDQTAELVKSCLLRNSSSVLIKYEHHHQNIGMMPNFKKGLELCTGKYIALCDGDDYWTDPLKLQKQVDFLEANEDYVICFHAAHELRDDGSIKISDTGASVSNTSLTCEDLALGNFLHTPTVVFRNLLSELPHWFAKCTIGDYPLFLILSQHGKIKYMPEVMAVYRIHNNSSWSSLTGIAKWTRWMDVLEILSAHFDGAVAKNLSEQKFRVCLRLSELYKAAGKNDLYFSSLASAFAIDVKKTEAWLQLNSPYVSKEKLVYPSGVYVSFKHFIRQLKYRMKLFK